MILSAVYFIAGSLITDGRITLVREGSSWLYILGLGLWSTMVSNFTGVKAVRRIGPTLTSIMGALQPLTAVVLGVLFLDEHLGVRTVIGIAIIMVAVMMVVTHQKTRKHV
jgi:drug/metabolite transporter (DMT)-like permease